jgi:hypothetical protein
MMERNEKKRDARFSASKRDFLKKAALFGVYIGPVIRTFEMAEISGKPTGPPKKKKEASSGTVLRERSTRSGRTA